MPSKTIEARITQPIRSDPSKACDARYPRGASGIRGSTGRRPASALRAGTSGTCDPDHLASPDLDGSPRRSTDDNRVDTGWDDAGNGERGSVVCEHGLRSAFEC